MNEDAQEIAPTTEKSTAAPCYPIPPVLGFEHTTPRAVVSMDCLPSPASSGLEPPKSGVWSRDTKGMRKLSRAMMPAWKVRQLSVAQQGLCAVCQLPVDLSLPKEGVVDHNHTTGEIRGVLHRSCNAALGKAEAAIGSWGCKSMSYDAIIPYLQKMLTYYLSEGCGMIYPAHVDAATAAAKSRDKRNLAAKERRANIKARKAMRDQRE